MDLGKIKVNLNGIDAVKYATEGIKYQSAKSNLRAVLGYYLGESVKRFLIRTCSKYTFLKQWSETESLVYLYDFVSSGDLDMTQERLLYEHGKERTEFYEEVALSSGNSFKMRVRLWGIEGLIIVKRNSGAIRCKT